MSTHERRGDSRSALAPEAVHHAVQNADAFSTGGLSAGSTESRKDLKTADRWEVRAVIYKPARTAMQAGMALTRQWVLEFEPASAQVIDPLMGWTGSADTRRQLTLRFPTRIAAEQYARANNLAYVVREPQAATPNRRSYGDNFRRDRIEPWSH
ncbi:MAG TPA: ETC complex I subunit [Alphaproteobacteria bacterium]|nr:ETC complex I subunit [Alphaproteobacteria bacterium]